MISLHKLDVFSLNRNCVDPNTWTIPVHRHDQQCIGRHGIKRNRSEQTGDNKPEKMLIEPVNNEPLKKKIRRVLEIAQFYMQIYLKSRHAIWLD